MHFSEINFGFPLWKLQLFMFPPGFLLNFLWIARQSMWQFLAPCLKTINLPTKNHLGRTALVFWYENSIILPKPIHRKFLEHWNGQKIISNIRQRFSCLLDEWIAKKWKASKLTFVCFQLQLFSPCIVFSI